MQKFHYKVHGITELSVFSLLDKAGLNILLFADLLKRVICSHFSLAEAPDLDTCSSVCFKIACNSAWCFYIFSYLLKRVKVDLCVTKQYASVTTGLDLFPSSKNEIKSSSSLSAKLAIYHLDKISQTCSFCSQNIQAQSLQ